MTVLAMSDGELSRFDTLQRVQRGELRATDAARLLGFVDDRFIVLATVCVLKALRALFRASEAGRAIVGMTTHFASMSSQSFASIITTLDRRWRVSILPSATTFIWPVRRCGSS